jgi:hypothetical protein
VQEAVMVTCTAQDHPRHGIALRTGSMPAPSQALSGRQLTGRRVIVVHRRGRQLLASQCLCLP